jgi:hypothetical protein
VCFLLKETKLTNVSRQNFMWHMSITYRIHLNTQIFELTDNWSTGVTDVFCPHFVCAERLNPW